MACLRQPTFNHARRSQDALTSMLSPIRAAVRAAATTGRTVTLPSLRAEINLWCNPLSTRGVPLFRRTATSQRAGATEPFIQFELNYQFI